MSNDYKKAVSIGGKNITNEAEQARLDAIPKELRINTEGIACGPLIEPIPSYIKAECETVLEGANNTSIVFGRDRAGPRTSGYGGRGDTQAGSIDIVVGRMGANAKSFTEAKSPQQRIWADPDCKKDAARIYISQKTDVDKNFGLATGKVGDAKAKSAICMKADGLRFVARDGIKLVTRTDRKNSQDGDILSAVGIDLLATNNDEDLQPIPRGKNLAEAIERLAEHLDKLNGVVDSLIMTQNQFNFALTHHFHYGPAKIIDVPLVPGFIWQTSPSMSVQTAGIKCAIDLLSQDKQSLINHKINLATYKKKYLTHVGEKYINSRYNNTT